MSLNQIVEDVSVVDILSKGGYTIIRSIFTGDENRVKYLKTYNGKGMIVYILLDIEDEVVHDDGERGRFIVKRFSGKSRVPLSSTRELLEKNPDASGVVFECSDELCVMVRKNDRTIENPIFRVFDPLRSESIISLDEGMSGYPLIRLSEIILDPEGAEERATELTEFIFAESVKYIHKESEMMSKMLIALEQANNKFVSSSVAACVVINREKKAISDKLEQIQCPIQRENLKRNVFLREDSRDKILKLQKEIFSLNHYLKKLLPQFDNAITAANGMFNLFDGEGEGITIYDKEDTTKILRM